MKENRSRTIPEKVKRKLWAVSAGRCEFQGCNKILYEHSITKENGVYAENAHIQAVNEGGSRFDESISNEELNSTDNLMLLCAECHKNIDDNEKDYPVEILKLMKNKHEERIRMVTENDFIQETIMINYFVSIQNIIPSYEDSMFRRAVIKNNCKLNNKNSITIGNNLNILNDGSKEFYDIQVKQLESMIISKVKPSIENVESISVFALAPQPLLIKLGSLLSDIQNVKVYQCHREGDKWSWKDTEKTEEFKIEICNINKESDEVVLNISLSADISMDRISKVINKNISIYKITIEEPNRNFVKTENIANKFIECYRKCIEKIKNENTKAKKIKVFPAMPNSLAVRMGMDIMGKTDLPLEIYDQVDPNLGFVKTIDIGG